MGSDKHHDGVAHHFENADQQYQAAKLGMWVFLVTEILFFGGLFCAYVIYRVNHPEVFIYAHHFLDKTLGAVNTIILICSSFTMAWAVRAAQLKQRSMIILMLVLTIVFAFGFMGVKGIEYTHKWKHGLLWAAKYSPDAHAEHETGTGDEAAAAEHGAEPSEPIESAEPAPVPDAGPAAPAPKDKDRSNIPPSATGPKGLADPVARAHEIEYEEAPKRVQLFFSIYFLMTGLHGIHVVLGIAAMLWLILRARRGDFDGGNFVSVDMVGLYWHLVDLIWIYLFLLLYLVV